MDSDGYRATSTIFLLKVAQYRLAVLLSMVTILTVKMTILELENPDIESSSCEKYLWQLWPVALFLLHGAIFAMSIFKWRNLPSRTLPITCAIAMVAICMPFFLIDYLVLPEPGKCTSDH